MPTLLTKGPKSGQDLFDEQMLKEKRARSEREAGADLQEEIRTIERDDGEEITHTATGKMIVRNTPSSKSSVRRTLYDAWLAGGMFTAAEKLMGDLIGFATSTLVAGAATSSAAADNISAAFGSRVKPHRALQPQHDDGEYIYDAMNVSQPVYEKLMKEADIIAAKLEELEAIDDPAKRDEMEKALEKLAEEFEMRLHPVTKVYVHDFNRVLREEQEYRGPTLNREFRVCVYLHKSQLDDLRGIKAKIGDPYNEDPQEAIAAGDHLKGHAPAYTPSGP